MSYSFIGNIFASKMELLMDYKKAGYRALRTSFFLEKAKK